MYALAIHNTYPCLICTVVQQSALDVWLICTPALYVRLICTAVQQSALDVWLICTPALYVRLICTAVQQSQPVMVTLSTSKIMNKFENK